MKPQNKVILKVQRNFISKDPANFIENFNCPICQDLFINPVVILCGHIYCEKCFFEASLYKSACGLCRKKSSIVEGFKCHIVNRLISDYTVGMSASTQNCLENRRVLHSQWQAERFIESAEVDKKLDVLEAPDIWKKATVVGLIDATSQRPRIKVHFDGWAHSFDEELSLNSRRIAPANYVLANRRSVTRSQTIQTHWRK